MREYTDEELNPYICMLSPFEGCTFAGIQLAGFWREVAIALLESSASEEHAKRIVARFVREPRFDAKENLITAPPAAIELRVFAQRVPADPNAEPGMMPPACELCAPNCGLGVIVTSANGSTSIGYCTCERGKRRKVMVEALKAGKVAC